MAAARILAVIGLSSLAACAQLPAGAPATAPAAPPAAQAPDPHARLLAEPAEENLPDLELTPQILYQLLLAEISGQRGNLALSTSAYLDLAKKTRDPRIARRASEIAHFSRQPDAALEATRLWVELEPKSLRARQMLAALLVGLNRVDDALPHLEEMVQLDPENRGEGFERINRLFARTPDKQAALRAIDRLTAPYPELAGARYARAEAAHAAGDKARALAEIDAALALQPDFERAVLLKGQVQSDDPKLVVETFERFLAKYPKAREVRLQYARALVSDKRYADSRAQFQRLLTEFPNNADVIYAVGVLSFQLDDLDTARESFLKLTGDDYPNADSVRLYLGQIAENRKQPDEALRWYGAVGAGEQYLTAQLRVAQLLADQGKLDEARRHLQSVPTSNNRERTQLLVTEAHLLRDQGQAQAAFDLLDQAVVAQPANHDLLYEAALAAERVGRFDLVESHLRKAVQVKPDSAHAYNALGYSFADRNVRLDEAQQLIHKALELAPDDAFILDSMGWVLYRKGAIEDALHYLQRAYALRPDPEIAAHLGEVLWVMGRKDEATKTWREAEKSNPGNEILANVIKRYLP